MTPNNAALVTSRVKCKLLDFDDAISFSLDTSLSIVISKFFLIVLGCKI
jgi:hypothetical protein